MADEIPEQVFTDAAEAFCALNLSRMTAPAQEIMDAEKADWYRQMVQGKATSDLFRAAVASAYAAGQAAAHNSGGEWQWGTEVYPGTSEVETDWSSSRRDAEDNVSYVRDRYDANARLVRRRVGPVEAVTADTEGQRG